MKKYIKPAIRLRQMFGTESSLASSFNGTTGSQDTNGTEEVDDGSPLGAKSWVLTTDEPTSKSSMPWDD